MRIVKKLRHRKQRLFVKNVIVTGLLTFQLLFTSFPGLYAVMYATPLVSAQEEPETVEPTKNRSGENDELEKRAREESLNEKQSTDAEEIQVPTPTVVLGDNNDGHKENDRTKKENEDSNENVPTITKTETITLFDARDEISPTPTPQTEDEIQEEEVQKKEKEVLGINTEGLIEEEELSFFEKILKKPTFVRKPQAIKDTIVHNLSRHTYHANDVMKLLLEKDSATSVSILIKNRQDDVYKADFITRRVNGLTEYLIQPPKDLKPGDYILSVTDSNGETFEQDFTWGVLAINTNKSIYTTGETAEIDMAVLNRKGEMVCDADVTLEIFNPNAEKTTLSTGDGTINVSEFCDVKDKVDEPDFSTTYTTELVGPHTMVLEANTKGGGVFTITDSFDVRESVDFDVERDTNTRIYPPVTYDVVMNIKANRDFKGTIREYVPTDFDISQIEGAKDNGILEFDVQKAQPESIEKGSVLGVATHSLEMPFEGDYELTTEFGELYENKSLLQWLLSLGRDGHDGVDFAIDSGTPIKAADEGTIAFAGNDDYGTMVIIEHDWGTSTYGHLSALSVKKDDEVLKGEQIGLSGNTGISTGPHLHFGVKPHNFDKDNGYEGSVDPLPYLNIDNTSDENEQILGAATTHLSETLEWYVDIKKGDEIKIGYTYKAPEVSPEFYTLGPLQFVEVLEEEVETIEKEVIKEASNESKAQFVKGTRINRSENIVFEEARVWQIAVDATSTERPNGDGVASQWAVCFDNTGAACSASNRYQAINESSLNTTGYIGTGLSGLGGEQEEFVFTGSNSTSTVTNVRITFYADTQACNGGTCDDVTFDISLDGGYTASPQTQTMSTSSNGPYNMDFSGSWTGWDDLRTRFSRVVQGGGKPDTRDDDVRVYMVEAVVTYTAPITVSGTCDEYDRTTDCTDDGANEIAVAVNGALSGTADTTVDGAWTVTNVTANSGDVITVFIQAESTASERANAITQYDGSGNITGVELYHRHVTIGSDDNQAITHTEAANYDYTASGNDVDIIFDVINATSEFQNDINTNYTDETLLILTGNTLTAGGIVDTHDLEIESSATLTGSTNQIQVEGSYLNNGTYSNGCSSPYAVMVFKGSSTGETISGNLTAATNGAFCRIDVSGSGEWTIEDQIEITAANQTNPAATLEISGSGTLILGNGGGDHMEVNGEVDISSGGTFSTIQNLAQGDTTYCNSDDICIDINDNASPTSCSNCAIDVDGAFTIGKNVTVRLNSAAATETGIDVGTTGELTIEGTQDDSGTDTGTDSNTLRETLLCADDTWSADDHNGKYVRMTDGLAEGFMYEITDTIASDTNCATDTHDSITRADTSTSTVSVASITTKGTDGAEVCIPDTFTTDDDYVGRYLHDMTGTEGYYLIAKSVNDSTNCSGVEDAVWVIPDPDDPDDVSNLAVSDSVDITHGVKDGDSFEIIDFAEVTANATNNGYINNSASNAEIVIKYAKISELGREDTTNFRYGINYETPDGSASDEGVSIQYSYLHDNHRTIRLNNPLHVNRSNTVLGEPQGVLYNYLIDATQDGVNCAGDGVGTDGLCDIVGNRVERVSGNGDCTTVWRSSRNLIANNTYIDCDPGIDIQYNDGNTMMGNKVFIIGSNFYGIEILNGATKFMLVGNQVYQASFNDVYTSHTSFLDGLFVGNHLDFSLGGVWLDGVTSFYELAHNYFGAAAQNTSGDIEFDTGSGSQFFLWGMYDFLGSSTEVVGLNVADDFYISRAHDQTAGLTQVRGDYNVRADQAETPQNEGIETYNYADESFVDSSTSQFFIGTGTEDTDIDIAFNGGTLGGSANYYGYFIRCKNTNCVTSGTNAWDVYRDGIDVGDASTGSTFTDATTNVQFTISDAGTDYARGDIYLFAVYQGSGDTNTQKILTMMNTASDYTIGLDEEAQFIGTSGNPTLIQKDSGATSYSFQLNQGTINANYFEMTGADGNGMNLVSGTVTNLSNGTFDNIGAAGYYLTVDNAVMDGVGGQTWTGMVFDDNGDGADGTVTGPATLDVAPSGGCSDLWTFESTGNQGGSSNGESNDSDPGDGTVCTGSNGYLQWTDPGAGGTPTMDQLMRHGNWFDSQVEQPFYW